MLSVYICKLDRKVVRVSELSRRNGFERELTIELKEIEGTLPYTCRLNLG